jgi:phospholipid/cholesterol/gamma-HCH transport system substrate-binding protein
MSRHTLRRARPVSHRPRRLTMYAIGLLGIVLAGLLFWVGYNAPNNIPGRSYYVLYAAFADADNLTAHDQVRIAGRLVGQVLDPHPVHGMGEVTLQLESSVGSLRSDTTLEVRSRSPIGTRFVALDPGTRGQPLRSGSFLPASQTGASEELDVALSELDPATRAHAQALLNGLGLGVAGRGGDISAALGASPATLAELRAVSGAIAAHPGAAAQLIAYSAGAARGADAVRGAIASGLRPEDHALQPFSRAAAGLTAALRKAPGDLAASRDALAHSQALLEATSALTRDAVPALHAAPASFRQASALLAQARPSLRELNSTVKDVSRASGPTLRLLETLLPVLPRLDTLATASDPMLSDLGVRGCDIHAFLSNWESMVGYGEGDGNYFRLLLYGGNPQNVPGFATKSPPIASIHDDPYPAPCAAESEVAQGGR